MLLRITLPYNSTTRRHSLLTESIQRYGQATVIVNRSYILTHLNPIMYLLNHQPHMYIYNNTTRITTHMRFRQRMLMSSQRKLHYLKRRLIRPLPTRVLRLNIVLANSNNLIRRFTTIRHHVINQRNTAVSTNLSTKFIITSVVRRARYHFELTYNIRRTRHKTTILNVNSHTILDQRTHSTPRSQYTQRINRRRQQRPNSNRRKNSQPTARHAFPVLKPSFRVNISRSLISRTLPRFNRHPNSNITLRVSNRNLTIK